MKIKLISNTKELALARRIRKKVLEDEQGFPHEVNVDGNDHQSIHVLIIDGRKPVATARLNASDSDKGKIARIAILKSHRGLNLAKKLIRYLERKAKMMCLNSVVIEPHSHLENFFTRLGYQKLGMASPIDGFELIKLEKKIIW